MLQRIPYKTFILCCLQILRVSLRILWKMSGSRSSHTLRFQCVRSRPVSLINAALCKPLSFSSSLLQPVEEPSGGTMKSLIATTDSLVEMQALDQQLQRPL